MAMAKYMHLVGAEEVTRAAQSIARSAEGMNSAASSIDGTLQRQQMFMDDWLRRLESVLTKGQSNGKAT